MVETTEELFGYKQNHDVIEEKVVILCSRLRKRTKKSMEYYGGDYSIDWLPHCPVK